MEIETHPFEPWLPTNAKLLMLGTFPPAPKRWAMEWYYPNFTNDMWRIFGLIFFGDKLHFVDEEKKTYRLNELKQFLKEKVWHSSIPLCAYEEPQGRLPTRIWK